MGGAHYNLGLLYNYGVHRVIAKNPKQAWELIEKAADLGHFMAPGLLRRLAARSATPRVAADSAAVSALRSPSMGGQSMEELVKNQTNAQRNIRQWGNKIQKLKESLENPSTDRK